MSDARESDDLNSLLRTYRGLLYVELEMTHLPGLENETHIDLAEAYCEKANEAARKSSDLGNFSKVQFDRACITERKANLARKHSKVSAPSLRKMWNQAFEEFDRIARELGKIEDLPVDMMVLRIRALHKAGRMAVKLRSISLHSHSILPILEDKSAKDYSLNGENLVSVSDAFPEVSAVIERFRRELDLSQLDPTEMEYLTRADEDIRLSFNRELL